MAGPGAGTRNTDHYCHAKGCKVRIPPSMFMHKRHWYMLPKAMRDAIWDTYVPGQEFRKNPSEAYLAAARTAIDYIAKKEGL